MREPITLYAMNERATAIHDGYHFQPHGWLGWLQRLCWWALVKMRAVGPAYRDVVTVIRLPLNGDDIVDRIFKAREGLFQIGRQPTEVIIGPETLAEIISAPAVRDYMHPFSFTGTMGFDRKLFDLKVNVEPQIEGMLVR